MGGLSDTGQPGHRYHGATGDRRESSGRQRKEFFKSQGFRTIIYQVKDLARAKELYGALLGVAPSMDEAYYIWFSIEGQEVGLDHHGHSQDMTGPVGYWHVDDINERLERLLAAGAEVQLAVRDVGGGKLIATLKDGDGNIIGLIQPP
jgi:predicted enzyme related to lactoylglutathione lyase